MTQYKKIKSNIIVNDEYIQPLEGDLKRNLEAYTTIINLINEDFKTIDVTHDKYKKIKIMVDIFINHLYNYDINSKKLFIDCDIDYNNKKYNSIHALINVYRKLVE